MQDEHKAFPFPGKYAKRHGIIFNQSDNFSGFYWVQVDCKIVLTM